MRFYLLRVKHIYDLIQGMETFTTAQDMQASLLNKIDALVKQGKPTPIYKELGKMAGISTNRIRFFHQGTQPNLSAPLMDELMTAVRVMERLTQEQIK